MKRLTQEIFDKLFFDRIPQDRVNELLMHIADHAAPVLVTVPLRPSIAIELHRQAFKAKIKPETMMAEAIAAYLGEV